MAQKYTIVNEEQLKKELNIDNWNQLSKDKIISFLKLMPNTDPEIVKLAIKQFPDFVKLVKDGMNSIEKIGSEALKGSKESLEHFNKQCDIVLDSLKDCLKDDKLSFDEKAFIINQMRDILVLAENKVKFHHEFLLRIFYGIRNLFIVIVVAALAIFGIKVKDKNNT